MRRFVFSSSAFFGEVGGVVKLFERVLQFPEEDDRFGENDVEYPDEDGEERSDFCFCLFFWLLGLLCGTSGPKWPTRPCQEGQKAKSPEPFGRPF